MSNKIILLEDHVANQIAAGEVIQRPSSIVKELMENSIDAGAIKIDLIIKDSGKTLIQVIDDGCGIVQNDLTLAFQRHSTSKIRTAEDLFSLKSKGFRGEALASISAISHVHVISKTSKDSLAKYIKIAGSKTINEDYKVAPLGTVKVSPESPIVKAVPDDGLILLTFNSLILLTIYTVFRQQLKFPPRLLYLIMR